MFPLRTAAAAAARHRLARKWRAACSRRSLVLVRAWCVRGPRQYARGTGGHLRGSLRLSGLDGW